MNEHSGHLQRGLQNRHIQLIALGGAIGTGLFLGIAQTIKIAGPAVLLGYAMGGLIAFLIMRQLGEMMVENPVAGSFTPFAYKYWGSFAGFASGWNYWVLYVLVSMAELTAVGIYIQFWWPEIPTWLSAIVFFILINTINLANVRLYGEIEFWFSIIKIIAIIGMILFGTYLLLSNSAGPASSVANLWRHGGFFPNGWVGLAMSMAIIMFSFGGLELIGITAAEAADPEHSIPKATNQVVYKILIFYIGSLIILLSLYPWVQIIGGSSPFVLIFHNLNNNLVANALNIVVVTAALSVYNSSVYSNSRMLYGLAQQGNAPKALLKVDNRGVPYLTIAFSALATGSCVIINYFIPAQALHLLMALSVSSLVINWALISITHLLFRKAMTRAQITTRFKALWHPLGNYLCLLFLLGILVVMYLTPDIRISVILIPCWLLLLWGGYWIKQKVVTKRD